MTPAHAVALDDDWWQRIAGPTDRARGLPNHYYWSEDVLYREQSHLFGRTWCFAGRAGAVPAPGDARPVEVAGQPLFLVRDESERVRVFHNVCPHRGARLVSEARTARKRLVCPYHAWTYGLDGRLVSRPHYDGPGQHASGAGPECDPISLVEVRSHTWFDWVFVDLSGECAPFARHMRPLLERLEHFPLSEFRHRETLRCEFASNWKLVAENHFDVYHVFRVHPDLNRVYRGPRTNHEIDGVLMFNEYFADASDRSGGLQNPPGLPASWSDRVFYGNLFPNLGVSAYASSVMMAEFVPLAPDRTAMEMHFYFSGDDNEDAEIASGRDQVLAWWRALNAEDEAVCELMQLGRRSAAYSGGRLAPHWDRVTQHFARMVAESLQA